MWLANQGFGWQIKASVGKSRLRLTNQGPGGDQPAGWVPINVVFFEGGRFSNTPREDSPRRVDLNQQRGFHTGFHFPLFFLNSPNFFRCFFLVAGYQRSVCFIIVSPWREKYQVRILKYLLVFSKLLVHLAVWV